MGAQTRSRITETGFRVGIGIFLGIAVALAIGRTYLRVSQTRRVSVDDAFFYLAVVALIGGTITCYVDVPYIYVPQNVDPSTFQTTPEFTSSLQQILKFQAAASALLSVALFSVKLSFLCFFHAILRRCSSPASFMRQNRLIQAAAVLDIFTDLLLIAIPVALLWRVRISLRRKLILMFVLGLSIFTIILSIVRIGGAQYPASSIDSAWMVFWLQLEAAVAVIIVSITSYRSLFVKYKSMDKKSPRYHKTSYKRILWDREKQEPKGVEMPKLPNPTLTGMRTVIGRGRDSYDDRFSKSDEFFLPPTAKGIIVTREADV
ncbi:MAG: hypothetical protein Q9204_007835, partial [Flavoplaca sp. TL-2023a]